MSDSRGEISSRHELEWQKFREAAMTEVLEAPERAEEKFVKSLKYIADTLRIVQDGERRAFEFSAGEAISDSPLFLVWDDGDSNAEDTDTL